MQSNGSSADRERSPRRSTVTVRTVAGNVMWGPTTPQTPLTVESLIGQLDRPGWCAEMNLVLGDRQLSLDEDVSQLPGDTLELQVVLKEGPAINHTCIEEFLELANENEMEYELKNEKQIEEFRGKFASRPAYEGISSKSRGASEKLTTTLNTLIDKLKQSQREDYHPGTNNVVRDIVHPSMYPYISGKSVLAEGLSAKDLKTAEKDDMWGRPYERSIYQWLPAEVTVAADGKCSFTSYINNLPQDANLELYKALEELLGESLPHFERCLSYAKAVKFVPNLDPMDIEDILMDYDGFEQPELAPQDLKGKKLQVIVKIVDMEVPAGGVHEGVWHVEGMSHENIAATAELILQKDPALEGADLEFKRAFTIDEAGTTRMEISQVRSRAVDEFVSTGLIPLGKLNLPVGTLAAWPNSHVHRITPLKNSSSSTALRRIVVFWLVNPERRIISTASVPAQQENMPLEATLEHRLKLMQERKRHKQDWNVREISLCEH